MAKIVKLRPLTHAPEIGSRNRRHNFDARFGRHKHKFDARLRTTSNVVDCLRVPKAVNDVRSRTSARKTGAGI